MSTNMPDDAAIVQPKPGEVFEDFDIRQAANQLVVCSSDTVHQPVFIARILDGGHNRKSTLPRANHLDEQLGRILEIGSQNPNRVSLRLQERVHARSVRAKVSGIENDLNARLFRRHLPQDLYRPSFDALLANKCSNRY